MRLIILLLALIGTVILLVQNQQAIALYFLGTDSETALFSLKLPLGVWVILFAMGGILTSLFIQLLTRSPRQLTAKQPSKPRPRSQDTPETPYQRPQEKRSDWEVPPKPEWEDTVKEVEDDDEWDIEEPPIEQTIPRKSSPLEETRSEFEVQQPPKTVSREGTVYSYTYRELSDRVSSPPPSDPVPLDQPHEDRDPQVEKKPPATNPGGEVYDANYRIITPPYQPSQDRSPDEEEDETWI